MKMRPKCTDARNMNTMVTSEMRVESNAPMLRLRVEKPPAAHTENAWQMASKALIPAAQ